MLYVYIYTYFLLLQFIVIAIIYYSYYTTIYVHTLND